MSFFTNSLFGPPGLILLGAVASAIGAIWAASEQAEFERELRAKSEENAELSRKALYSITGGDSFAYFSVLYPSTKTVRGRLLLHNEGEYPMYELSARIVDLEKELGPNPTIDQVFAGETHLSLGAAAPKSARILGHIDLGPGPTKAYNIFFSARNGFYTQLLRLAVVDGKWVSATRVVRDEKAVYERIDPGFPQGSNGMKWG